MKPTSRGLPHSLQRFFFTERLVQQRQASPHTICSYRDTFRLLLQFILKRLHKTAFRVAFEDIDAPLISEFLDDLQNGRGITARSRNIRLAAIRSFFKFAAFELPTHSAQIQRVLAIPSKRYICGQVGFLIRAEVECTTDGAHSEYVVWASRSRFAVAHSANQCTAVGDYAPQATRRKPGCRCAHPSRRQGAQATLHAADEANSRCFEVTVAGACQRK